MALIAERDVAQAFADELGQRLGSELDRIVLFGSVARGQHGSDSDVDVLILLRGRRDPLLLDRAHDLALELEERYAAVLSLKILGRADVERTRPTAFWQAVEREGIDLWTRQPD